MRNGISKKRGTKEHFKARLKPFYYFLFSALATMPPASAAAPESYITPQYVYFNTEPYHPRITLNGQAGSYGFAQIDYVYPLFTPDSALLFFDGRFQAATLGSKEINLGLVYRQLVLSDNNILGAYAWIDQLDSVAYKYYKQATFGGEFLGKVYDFRANAYIPFGTKSYQVGTTSTPSINGNTVSVLDQGTTEQSLPGADIEVGRVVPCIPKLHAFLDYFRFGGGDNPLVHGERARIEYHYQYNMVFTASYSYDNVRQGIGFVGLRIGLGGVDQAPETPMRNRMEDFVIRDVDIITVQESQTPVVFTDSRKYWFVDNTAPAGGDGTVEHPFNTEAAAEAAAGNGEIIYTYQGNGNYTLPGGGLNLKENQLFTGSGGDLVFHNTVILRATTAPVLNGRINVANGATLSNFTLSGSGSSETVGIYGNGVSNVTLSNLTVQDFTGASADGADYTGGGSVTGGNGGSGTSVTGIQLINSTNATLTNVTVKNIAGGSANGGDGTAENDGSYNYGTGGAGGTGGDATGIDLTNTSTTLTNVTVSGITGGSANGGDGSGANNTGYTYYKNEGYGGAAGTGGNAKGINLANSTSAALTNVTVTNVSGGSAVGGDGTATGDTYGYYGNYAGGGNGGTGGTSTAIDLSNAIANLSHISVSNILGGSARGGDANSSGATVNYSYGGNGGNGGNAMGIIETGATISSNNLTFSNVTGGSATGGTGATSTGTNGTAGTSTNIVP